MRELIERYAWADEDYDLAWTVAAIDGMHADAVLVAYGADPSSNLGEVTFAEALVERNDHLDEYGLLQVRECGRQMVAFEPNGWAGNSPAVAETLSAHGGHFFSVYWSPVAYQIIEARDGRLTARFDPNFIGLPAGANDMMPGWVGDDDFPLAHLRSASMAALHQQTGIAIDRAWLTEPLATYRIPESS